MVFVFYMTLKEQAPVTPTTKERVTPLGLSSKPGETVTVVTPDVQVDVTPAPAYTESQKANQRLLLHEHRGESQPGEGLKRVGVNAAIFTGSTLADLVEGNIVTNLFREKLKKRVEDKAEAYYAHIGNNTLPHDQTFEEISKKLERSAKIQKGIESGFDLAEEWASDNLYGTLANAWVQAATGVKGAKYVSETSAFVSDWGNMVSQVFLEDFLIGKTLPGNKKEAANLFHIGKWNVKAAYKTYDYINPVNVEALLRMVEEVPVVGDGVHWLHEQSNTVLESKPMKWVNSVANKFLLGIHIGKNMMDVKNPAEA